MKLGVIVPQGWNGEYDGWESERAWARTVEVGAAGRGDRRRVDLDLRPLPHRPSPDR